MNAEIITFVVAAALAVTGALGVVLARNPVHSALLLVQTLFAVAVLFVAKEAYFLAAVQIIVYAGAIVILFLFVIMLVGVDRAERLEMEPIVGIRPVAVVAGVALLASLVTVILSVKEATGTAVIPIDPVRTDIEQLGDRLFTDWVFAFELTGLLLTIAVVGAVVLARRPRGDVGPVPEPAPMIADFNARANAPAGGETDGGAAEAGDAGVGDAEAELGPSGSAGDVGVGGAAAELGSSGFAGGK